MHHCCTISVCVCVCVCSDQLRCILCRLNLSKLTGLASLNGTPDSKSTEVCLRSDLPLHRPGRHGGTARGGRYGRLSGCPNFRTGSSGLCGSAGGEAHYSRWQSLTSCVASGGLLSRKGTFSGKKEKLKQNALRISGYYFSFQLKKQSSRIAGTTIQVRGLKQGKGGL